MQCITFHLFQKLGSHRVRSHIVFHFHSIRKDVLCLRPEIRLMRVQSAKQLDETEERKEKQN